MPRGYEVPAAARLPEVQVTAEDRRSPVQHPLGTPDVEFEAMIRALNRGGYHGPLSIEWEDSGMDRDWGVPDALAFVRRTDFAPSSVAFDAAFAREA